MTSPQLKTDVDRLGRALKYWPLAVITAFALLIPVAMIVMSYLNLAKIDESAEKLVLPDIYATMPKRSQGASPEFDYTLIALNYIETSNRHVMVTKQRMKLATMQIGFAVISVGFMFIFLGVNQGGLNFSLKDETGKVSIEAKTASTGVATFLLGALMVAGGGMVANDFHASDIPAFGIKSSKGTDVDLHALVAQCEHAYESDHVALESCVGVGVISLTKEKQR